MTAFLTPRLVNANSYLAPNAPPSSGSTQNEIAGSAASILASAVPASRVVVFEGGSRYVTFEGGTRVVTF